ncbi:histidine--tRNA ligase [Pelagibacteraceae bacterium]|jgi:histidyl-tRNA synthetase|nr:histidine--tRNA ligase [Pelagibacteraceae bacterium]MDC1125101.1 histidine--tRNA ligase [Pelagibacteraceae bacterium]
MKKEKNNKPPKELPLGFVDRQEKELLVRDFIISNIKEVMIKYGFQYLETPSFEYSESIGKFLPDKDRPDEGVFSFQDENKWLSLRYDLTAPLARYVAKNYLEIQKPFKRYQLGTVWRNEKPGPGRFREFLQFDADFVGTKSLQADAELCVMISEILEKCGLNKEEYIVKISSRKITEELFKRINIDNNEQKLTALRALDKLDRLGWEGVNQLLGDGRKDKSGDFTKGANLSSSNIEAIENELKKKSPETEDLQEIIKLFKDYNFNNFEFDPSIIRGLEYYTGPIFEVNLKFDVKNNKGQIIQFGSIGGGGRYDNLVNNFGNYEAPATGISIGLDRLVYALMQKKEFKVKQSKPVVICIFDKNSMKEYIGLQTLLRNAGISTEIYPGESKLKKQMEYANKIKSPAVILYGEDEIKSSKPTLRNLSTGKEKSIEIKELVNEIKKII